MWVKLGQNRLEDVRLPAPGNMVNYFQAFEWNDADIEGLTDADRTNFVANWEKYKVQKLRIRWRLPGERQRQIGTDYIRTNPSASDQGYVLRHPDFPVLWWKADLGGIPTEVVTLDAM